MNTITIGTYRDLDMTPEGTDIKTIAGILLEGRAAYVELQPGDANTRYQFYLIPQTDDLRIHSRSLGYGPWTFSRYVWIAPVNLAYGQLSGDIISLRSGQDIYYEIADIYPSDHTKMVITVFLDLVGKHVDALDTDMPAAGQEVHEALEAIQPLNAFARASE